MNRVLHIRVSGRVQGVSFRFHAQRQAIKLNLKGWVRNLVDGQVEIIVSGEAGALQQLVNWCHQGPSLAVVDEVIVNEINIHEKLSGFEIR